LLASAQHRWERILQRRTLFGRIPLTRIGKFLVVGGLGTLVNMGVLVLLYHQLHLALIAASVLATELAIGHNFLWNNYWTFGRHALSFGRFARFNVASLGGQGITVATLWMLVRYTGVHYVIANMAGIGVALIWNFAVSVCWTWGPEKGR
jgi:dolichol-phosphate mannosyltransferase